MTYDDLIKRYHTQTGIGEALAELEGKPIAQSSISEWKVKGVPLYRQAQFEILTRGRLKADRPYRKNAA